MAASGQSVHGEVDLVTTVLAEHMSSATRRVLDAGCGTGRVAIELTARGIETVGVDLDQPMLDEARKKAPEQSWVLGDLATVQVDGEFDAVVMAGNVMIFVAADTEPEVVRNMASHLIVGGLLLAGFQTGGGRLEVDDYDDICAAEGLVSVARWSTWDREPFAGGDYAVSVHRKS